MEENQQEENKKRKIRIKDLKKIKIIAILSIIVIIIFLLLVVLLSFSGVLNKEAEASYTLTINDDGVFRTYSKYEDHGIYTLYAVLDEMRFKKYINEKGYNWLFERGYDDESYKSLKEMIVRAVACKYPTDVVFVLDKTIKYKSGEDQSDQNLVESKIKDIINQSPKTINGCVNVYRNEYDEVLMYHKMNYELQDICYCINFENGKMGIGENSGSRGTVSRRYENDPENDPKSEIQFFDYQALISPYIMPPEFIMQLYIELDSEEFVEKVMQIVENSNIELTVYSETTKSDLKIQGKYEYSIEFWNKTEVDNSSSGTTQGGDTTANGNTKNENHLPTKKNTYLQVKATSEQTEDGNIQIKEKKKIIEFDTDFRDMPTEQPKDTINLKMYITKVDNWVAKIVNVYKEVEADAVIYDDIYKVDGYKALADFIRSYGNRGGYSPELLEAVEEKQKKFEIYISAELSEVARFLTGYNYDFIGAEKKLIEEKIHLEEHSVTYVLDENAPEALLEDNTDYFCGLFRNSSSTTYDNKKYTWIGHKNADAYKYPEINLKNTDKTEKNLEKFPKFNKNGNRMCYTVTNKNTLICPYDELRNSDIWYINLSDGDIDETLHLIWDKLYTNKDVEDKIKFNKEIETIDINDTSTCIKDFIKSWEGTHTDKKDETYQYHYVNSDYKGIPNADWGINLLWHAERYKPYLGEFVYTPAFFKSYSPAKKEDPEAVGAFKIHKNIIYKVFEEMIAEKYKTINDNIKKYNIKGKYLPTQYEADALIRISWKFGNYGFIKDYFERTKEAHEEKDRAMETAKAAGVKNPERFARFTYYQYLRDTLTLKDGKTKFFKNYSTSGASFQIGDKGQEAFLIYAHGLYYRRDGELIGAESKPIKTALAIYQYFVNYGYTYSDDTIFYIVDETGDTYADSGEAYGLGKEDSEKHPLTINDFEYVTWVFRDLRVLDMVYTNYESFIKGIVKDEKSKDYNKLEAINNEGGQGVISESGGYRGIEYDDLLPGDIVLVRESDDKVTAKIYAGRYNWIEMDKKTLEDLQDDGKRAIDDSSYIYMAPIANYKGGYNIAGKKSYGAKYGEQINFDNILWVFRSEKVANQYLYNDSYEYVEYEVIDNKLSISKTDIGWEDGTIY